MSRHELNCTLLVLVRMTFKANVVSYDKVPKKRVCVWGGGNATNKPILSLQSRQYKRSIAKPSEISWLTAFVREPLSSRNKIYCEANVARNCSMPNKGKVAHSGVMPVACLNSLFTMFKLSELIIR